MKIHSILLDVSCRKLANALRSSTQATTATTDHGARECNINLSAKNYGISSVDQTPYHQQMLKQQKCGRSKLERPCVLSL
ncbi:hypothetical protein H5410_050158 [Solanum commersonii]|uniref:Uncharacterized protein n=1 Tax=Solanum commersonii TaxID=4109 RepID=A0A9J5WUK4_SOLCO|nr:hypothetical protein H5410_050158 [Solanum commersonii]